MAWWRMIVWGNGGINGRLPQQMACFPMNLTKGGNKKATGSIARGWW
ncbi:MAG: hypothetical protein R3C62_24825 [Chloroflexota bacterium]